MSLYIQGIYKWPEGSYEMQVFNSYTYIYTCFALVDVLTSTRNNRRQRVAVTTHTPCRTCNTNSIRNWLKLRYEVLTAANIKMAVFWVVAPCSLVEVYNIKYCCTDLTTRKGNIHILLIIIFQSYFCFGKDFKEGISRSSQRSTVQRESPDRDDTTHNASGVELKLKCSGRTSQKTPTALVLTSNMQHS
jgi:hypothetical protein